MASLPPVVKKLGWISFYADVASEMAYPVLPLFLAAMGAPAAALGLIEGLAEATASLLKGWGGTRSDAIGKRTPFVRWGYGLSAVGRTMIAGAWIWPIVAVSRVIDRVGKGIRTAPRDALVAEAVDARSRGAAFGYHRAMDTAGAVCGVIVALLFLYFFPGEYRWIFLLAALPGLLSLYIAFQVKESSEASEEVQDDPVLPDPVVAAAASTQRVPLPPGFWRVLTPAILFGLANTSDAFLLSWAHKLGHSDSAVMGLYLAYNLIYALLAQGLGKLSDRVGRVPLLVVGWLLYAVSYAGFAWTPGAWLLVPFLLYGIYQAACQGATKAWVVDLAPKEARGTALGVFAMASGVAALLGNLAAGAIWDMSGSKSMLLAMAGLAVASVLALLLLRPKVSALS